VLYRVAYVLQHPLGGPLRLSFQNVLRLFVLHPLAPMLAPLIRLADAAYRAGVPLMSDRAFDRLARLAPNALPPLTTLLSLDCPPDPTDWLSRNPGPYTIQLKADGVSVNCIYEDGAFIRAHLRSGRDCTDAALRAGILLGLPGRPSGTVEIRCEAMALSEYQPEGAAPVSRNAVAAALRRRGLVDPADVRLSLLAFDLDGIDGIATQRQALSWLSCCGFATLECLSAETADDVLTIFASFCRSQDDLPFPCDGLVVKLDSKIRQRQLGADSRAPRWAISLKP